MPPIRCDRETTRLVAGDAAGEIAYRQENVLGTLVGGLLGWGVHVGVDAIVRENDGDGCRCPFGGTLALPDLVHVATFGGNVDVDVATDAVDGETGESLEVTGFDGEDERGLDGEV